MNRYFIIFILSLIALSSIKAQVQGRVIDQNQESLVAVNVYLKNSYNGTSTDAFGRFSLRDVKLGDTLIFSMLGFDTQTIILKENDLSSEILILMDEAFNKLKAVQVSAGSMEVSDEQKAVVLNPLDIVTTSGALGDVVGALKTLPGTANNANDGRLFVRGGSAGETAIFIDGLRLGNAFGTSLSGIPTRSRFSPQLFKGSYFSTGAYSAEFGQALSSVLSLNSVDFPLRRQTDIGLTSVGASISHTEIFKRQSITSNFSYTNLQPYMSFVPQNIEFMEAPNGLSAEILFRQKVSKRGLFKVFYAYQYSGLEVLQEQMESEEPQQTKLNNFFHHLNLNYKQDLNSKNLIDGGLSLSSNQDDIELDSNIIGQKSHLIHGKIRHQYFANNRLKFKFGTEFFQRYFQEAFNAASRTFNKPQFAAFAEGDYHFNSDLVLKLGLRQAWYANSAYLMPRVSMAYRLNNVSSFSLAYGDYFQEHSPKVLLQAENLSSSSARHLVLNYQFTKDNHSFRIEAYNKEYRGLLRSNPNYNAQGQGYARGFDFFWRNRGGISNLDYWISYSFIDSKRHWRGFESMVQPSFAPKHNASLVTKYWLGALNSQLGTSFNINNGYTYENPNLPGEMESRTKAFHSLNLSWSYLPKPNFIIHFEITNVLGRENVFGYQYSSSPNDQGQFQQMAIPQSAKRFVFLGIFYTLSSDKKANQLNNL